MLKQVSMLASASWLIYASLFMLHMMYHTCQLNYILYQDGSTNALASCMFTMLSSLGMVYVVPITLHMTNVQLLRQLTLFAHKQVPSATCSSADRELCSNLEMGLVTGRQLLCLGPVCVQTFRTSVDSLTSPNQATSLRGRSVILETTRGYFLGEQQP